MKGLSYVGSFDSMIYNHYLPINGYFKQPKKVYTKFFKISGIQFMIKFRIPNFIRKMI